MAQKTARFLFQSTLPRGERLTSSICCQKQIRFQSTLPRGERRSACVGCCVTVEISIHAPARGATRWHTRCKKSFSYFNPRSREGSDKLSVLVQPVVIDYFNPRSREGSDRLSITSSTLTKSISIHAPARGATAVPQGSKSISKFQSTLPRGERPEAARAASMENIISIHAPARGATYGNVPL